MRKRAGAKLKAKKSSAPEMRSTKPVDVNRAYRSLDVRDYLEMRVTDPVGGGQFPANSEALLRELRKSMTPARRKSAQKAAHYLRNYR